MKRAISALLACLLLCLAPSGCVPQERQLAQAEEFYQVHRELLASLAAQCQKERRVPTDLPGELENRAVYYDYATGMVQVQVGSFGIVPSTTYWGVYYSPEDTPLPYDGADVPLAPAGEGFAWERDGNTGYTQRLETGWYFFTASF